MSTENTPLLKPVDPRKCNFKWRKLSLSVIFPIVFIILLISTLLIQARKVDMAGPPLLLRIYTNNIRYDNKGRPDKYEQPWEFRRIQSINSMEFHTSQGEANVICLQEVLHNQLQDILKGLNEFETWDYFGVGRTDGKTSGEYAPILYKKLEFDILDSKTFWLSPTPDKPSKGWDAALERIVTIVTFQSKANPLIKFNVFNTHYDHRGVVARRESSLFIADKLKNYNGYPSFLAGDLNTEPTDEPHSILESSGFKDSFKLIGKRYSYGYNTSFTGFDKDHEPVSRIDYIWSPSYTRFGIGEGAAKDNSTKHFSVALKLFGIVSNWFNGYYFSDHRPVVATYELSRTPI
jgi:endonuclease/exonuclease/phosphatase family metal-dependent hydrolase